MSAGPLRAEVRVVANRSEGGTCWRLRLRVPGWPGFAPGQFVMLSPGALGSVPRLDPLLPRPMAVYRNAPSAEGSEIEVLYKRVGRGTNLLAEAAPGARVGLVGPLGRSFALPRAGERALLVGGGTGIASLYALAAQARRDAQVVVLLGARNVAELMGREDFAGLGVELRVATEDASEGHPGRVTELLEAALGEPGDGPVYACGPTPMMERAAVLARQAGRRCSVSLENTMACGFGVCLGCAAPLAGGGFALVCRDGPVLDAGDVDWKQLS